MGQAHRRLRPDILVNKREDARDFLYRLHYLVFCFSFHTKPSNSETTHHLPAVVVERVVRAHFATYVLSVQYFSIDSNISLDQLGPDRVKINRFSLPPHLLAPSFPKPTIQTGSTA